MTTYRVSHQCDRRTSAGIDADALCDEINKDMADSGRSWSRREVEAAMYGIPPELQRRYRLHVEADQ